MIYKSCLFEEAIDKALLDWTEIKKLREEQDKERTEWEEGENERKEAAEKAGEAYVPEPKTWEEINPAPFDTVEEKFVVCLDTLGQDRELTDDQKRFVLQTVEKYRNTWEQRENSMLEKDRDDRLKVLEADKQWQAENAEALATEEEQHVEEQLKELDEQHQPEDDDHKTLMMN